MKQKSGVFSWKLVREGFRQCQMIGILFTVVTLLGAVFAPLTEMIQKSSRSEWTEHMTKSVFTGLELNPALLIVVIMTPLMALVLFHFLNNRSSSDLYHALPHKRSTLFVSYTLAIVLWTLLILVLNVAVSLLMALIVHSYVIVLYKTIFSFVLTLFLITFLAMAGVLVAMSVTGTVFTNVIVSALLLFLPRTMMEIFYGGVTGNMSFYVASPDITGFFQSENNLLFSFVQNFLFGFNASKLTELAWQSILYTFLLAVIYLALGCFLFCRRRSETAGQAAPNRWLQHTYRIALTMVFCSFVTISLFNEQQIGADWILYLILYIIGVLIYCIYELITTKSWKSLGKALPGLAVVAVLNLAAYGGMHLAQNYIVSQRPAAQEIKSISLTYDGYFTAYTYLNFSDYVAMQAGDVAITDPTAIALASYYLDENLKTWENGGENAYYTKYYNEGYEGYVEYTVKMQLKDKSISRKIFIPKSEQEQWINALRETDDYVALWKTLPEPVEGTLISNFSNSVSLAEDDLAQVWEIYQEELAACDFEKLYNACANYEDIYATIEYQFIYKGTSYNLSCPIVSKLMPRTTERYAQYLESENAEETEALPDFLTQYDPNDLGFMIQIMDSESKSVIAEYYQDPYSSTTNEKDGTEITKLLYQYRKEGVIEPDDFYVIIIADGYEAPDENGVRSEVQSKCAIFPLEKGAETALMSNEIGLNWYSSNLT